MSVRVFFRLLAATNLQDIAGIRYSKLVNQLSITEEEILQAVINAAPNKISGEDGILNHIIKLALFNIIPVLTYVFYSSIMADYCSNHLRKSIIVSFCKPNKPDYSIPKVYKSMAFLQTIKATLADAEALFQSLLSTS